MPENVVGAVAKDDLKKYLLLAVSTFNGIAAFIPGDAGKTLKQISVIFGQVASQDWFIDLLYFLLNTFQNTTPTHEQLAQAVSHFTDKLKEHGTAPKIYTF
jgi:hypothetical protein